MNYLTEALPYWKTKLLFISLNSYATGVCTFERKVGQQGSWGLSGSGSAWKITTGSVTLDECEEHCRQIIDAATGNECWAVHHFNNNCYPFVSSEPYIDALETTTSNSVTISYKRCFNGKLERDSKLVSTN